MKRFLHAAATLVAAAAWLLLPTAIAHAHGGGEPVITGSPVGGYLVYVWVSPGSPTSSDVIHVTVGVTLPEGDAETPVSDATVTITAQPEDGSTPLIKTAEPEQGAGEAYYESDMTLPTAGTWAMTVAVDGSQGSGAVNFDLEVVPGPTNWVGAGGAILIALAGVVLVVLSRSRARRQARAMAAAGKAAQR